MRDISFLIGSDLLCLDLCLPSDIWWCAGVWWHLTVESLPSAITRRCCPLQFTKLAQTSHKQVYTNVLPSQNDARAGEGRQMSPSPHLSLSLYVSLGMLCSVEQVFGNLASLKRSLEGLPRWQSPNPRVSPPSEVRGVSSPPAVSALWLSSSHHSSLCTEVTYQCLPELWARIPPDGRISQGPAFPFYVLLTALKFPVVALDLDCHIW